MCFSASANFVGSAVLGAIGVATLTEVKHRRELFAAMPLLFALHQFTEGFVWLSLSITSCRQSWPTTPGQPSSCTPRACCHFCCR